jgi:alginate O-acetyltransferase complex protein AlgJ
MSPAPTNSNLKRRANICLFTVFLTFLWLPTLDTFLHFDRSSIPGENRLPAGFPKIKPGLDGLKKFIVGLEACFNDHFGFRRALIWSYRSGLFYLFHDQQGNRSAIIGRDGWLYFSEHQMVEHYRGTLLFTPDQLQDWKILLEQYRDWLAQRGIKFLFVVAPDKQSIYPEYLPSWMNKVSSENKLDQFFAYMKTHSTVEVLDLRPTLLENRSLGPLYLKTDSHWNQLGAFFAYQRLVNELAVQFLPGARPMPLDAFERTNAPAPPGDLTAMAGIDSPESNAILLNPKASLPSLGIVSQPYKTGPLTVTRNPYAGDSAIVYGDSFVNYWVPLLGYNFGQVSYYSNHLLASQFIDADLFKHEKPTVVIVEAIERSFNVAKPKDLLMEAPSK